MTAGLAAGVSAAVVAGGNGSDPVRVADAGISTTGHGVGDAPTPAAPSPKVKPQALVSVTRTQADGEQVHVSVPAASVELTPIGVPGQVRTVAVDASGTGKVDLAPELNYQAVVVGADGTRTPSQGVTGPKGPGTLTFASPLESGVVRGNGTVAVLSFTRDLTTAEQTAVERSLRVKTSPTTVEGLWYWTSPRNVHFRPKLSWKPGTKVQVVADLRDVKFTDGNWGTRVTWETTIGRARHITANLATDRMVITEKDEKGKVTKTDIPFSGGRLGHETRNGTMIALSAEASVIMDSSTVGIPKDSPAGYYLHVLDAVRITDSGEYIHGAPWSVYAQGHTNVSHGCLNVSPANARWIRTTTLPGDLVTVTGSSLAPNAGDRGAEDWSPSWSDLLKLSHTGVITTLAA